jgi:hypothetical protein
MNYKMNRKKIRSVDKLAGYKAGRAVTLTFVTLVTTSCCCVVGY